MTESNDANWSNWWRAGVDWKSIQKIVTEGQRIAKGLREQGDS